MMEIPVVLFPHPDSPTIPKDSPWPTLSETPSTATTLPVRMWNSVRRSFSSKTAGIGENLAAPAV